MSAQHFEVGHGLTCDIDRLIASRLLIQANSGGGKTRTLRRLLEQTHGRVQHLVIDPEGEYHTLRERFDYILAAPKGGDTVAHPRTAKLLAEKLLQLGVSAILDIYELNPDGRQAFVKHFLQSLVDAPRELWHPALVVLDEAHVYAPEGKESDSTSAVKAMASRGRKRGFCLVPATQRLAKLSKDVAAECNNKLIGRCTLDVDIKRAAEELGFTTAEQRLSLRQLEPGQFYAFGPAFDLRAPQLVLVGPIKTQHAEAGQQAAPVPPPTAKVLKLLPQLADLPAEAEAREKTVDDLKRDNATLRRQLTEAQKAQPPAQKPEPAKVVEKPVITDAQLRHIQDMFDRFDRAVGRASDMLAKPVSGLKASLEELAAAVKSVRQPALPLARPAPAARIAQNRPVNGVRAPSGMQASAAAGAVTPAKQKILNGLAFLHGIGVAPADKTQLALIVGVSPTSGGYFNNLGSLRSDGLIEYPSGGTVALTEAGQAIASTDGVPSTTAELHDAIRAKLPPAKWKIVERLIAAYPKPVAKDDLAERIGVSPTSGGFFNNLGSLRSLGLIDYPQPGAAAALPVLFLEG
jgi:uncharacterized protein DUF87